MSKKVIVPLIAVGILVGAVGCQANASMKAGTTEPKAATPPPPEPPPPPPPAEPPPPPPKPIKAVGKAKVEGNVIKFKEKIHFENDKATLKTDAETKSVLDDVCKLMQDKDNAMITTMRVDGHTDNAGGNEHNMKLSQDRADTVVAALVKCGVDKGRLEAHGYGEDRNIVPNDTAPNKEQNRRVEFRVWAMDGKPTDAQKHDDPPAGSAAALAAGGGGSSATPAVGATPAGAGKPDPKKPGTPTAASATPAKPKP